MFLGCSPDLLTFLFHIWSSEEDRAKLREAA